jgi:hypothetical protein
MKNLCFIDQFHADGSKKRFAPIDHGSGAFGRDQPVIVCSEFLRLRDGFGE